MSPESDSRSDFVNVLTERQPSIFPILKGQSQVQTSDLDDDNLNEIEALIIEFRHSHRIVRTVRRDSQC